MVTAGERDSIRGLFGGLVPDDLLDSYERLLSEGGCPKEEAEICVGGAAIVRALAHNGMAHVRPHTPAEPARFQPAPPDLALQGVLIGLQTRLLSGQEQLLDGYQRLADAQVRSRVEAPDEPPGHLVRYVADREEVSNLAASLMNTARKDWMTLENLDTDMPLTGDFAQPPLPVFGGRVRCRAIYAASVMDDPAGRRIVQACAEAGEKARLLASVPMKMKLADHTAALLPLTPAGTAGALLVHAPVITAGLREYFELLWEKATPIGSKRPAAAERLSPAQRTVLALMAEGLHDDAIARRAGLSTTTMRRHAAALMKRLNATSRFAAGAAAQRRGWIG